jgi:hypothetical protein
VSNIYMSMNLHGEQLGLFLLQVAKRGIVLKSCITVTSQ